MSSLSASLYGASTNKGVGGLLSGLDTDDLVKQMTAATRNKINRQYQSKQKLLYRQESYREISKKLLSFSDKYFSYASGSKTNILSPSFFESNTFKSSSPYVNVTGNAEDIKNFSINSITSVATAATFTTTISASSQSFSSSSSIMDNVSALAGATMSLEFNDKTYNLKLDDEFIENNKTLTIDNVVDQLNKQLATIEGNETNTELKYIKDGNKIKFGVGTANLVAASTSITSILKMEINKTAETSAEIDISLGDLIKTTEEVFETGSITFDLNGIKNVITLENAIIDVSESPKSHEEQLFDYLKEKLNETYGDKVVVAFDSVEKKISFSATEGNIINVNSIDKDLSKMIGIKAGDSNRLNTSVPINTDDTITINGKTINVDSAMSINDIMKKINNESDVNITYSSTTDKFFIKSKETGTSSKIEISGTLATTIFGGNINVANGQDTEMNVKINGQDMNITRSTANFAIDGINIELNKNAATKVGDTPITFDVTNNSDDVVEKVKQFINDYNEIITLIGTKTTEKPSKSYEPLTPEQQDDMEKDEIENWTKEAKKGILFSDNNMTTLLRELRTGMTGKTSVSDLVLSNIGISAASMDTSGKLVLDEKKFKEKLLENPDEISSLFTGISTETGDAKSGIAVQIQDIIRDNIGAFGTSGKLIEEAGLDSGRTSDQNNISLAMNKYDKKMEELKKDLEAERKRYWNQFSALEKALNNLNAQSSWLADSMG